FRLAETANVNASADVSVTVGGVSGSVGAGVAVGSTKSTLDFIDMNGDRYPDSVSGDTVLYGDGQGGFTSSANLGLGNLRDTSSRNIRGSVSLGAADRGQLLNLQHSDGTPRSLISTKVG